MKESGRLNLIEVGKRVREVREAKNLSGEELGARINRSQNAISKIERGLTAKVNIDNIRLIAKECDVSEDYLLLRSDYKTRKEEIQAIVGKMQDNDVMWMEFMKYIATYAGYKMSNCDNFNNMGECVFDAKKLNEPYLLFENEASSCNISIRDTNIYMEDITRYAELRLNMMIERKKKEGGFCGKES